MHKYSHRNLFYFKKFGKNVKDSNPTIPMAPGYFPDNHVNALKHLEGYREYPYFDSKGYLTIGHGINLDDAASRQNLQKFAPQWTDEKVRFARNALKKDKNFKFDPSFSVNRDVAHNALMSRVNVADRELRTVFPNFDTLPANVKQSLTHMHFQMGLDKIKKFKKMINHVNNGNYQEAAREIMDSLNAKLPRDPNGNIMVDPETGAYKRAEGIKRNMFASALMYGGKEPYRPENFDLENKFFDDDLYGAWQDVNKFFPNLLVNPRSKTANPTPRAQSTETNLQSPQASQYDYWTPNPGDTPWAKFNGNQKEIARFMQLNNLKPTDNIIAGKQYKLYK